MMTFTKYMHVERYDANNVEVQGLLKGTVHIFPKLDGSNHCVWYDEDSGKTVCASRNQIITEDNDSTHFVHDYYLRNKDKVDRLIHDNKNLVFYGEFMRPHVIKDYVDKVWDDWFIFDVFDTAKGRWLTYGEYIPMLIKYRMSYVPLQTVAIDPDEVFLNNCVEKNDIYMKDKKIGEGIVIKNYDYKNPYQRTTWGKIVRAEFKEEYRTPSKEKPIEQRIADEYTSYDFVIKEYHKYVDMYGEWSDMFIKDFIKYVWKEWWTDYSFVALSGVKGQIDLKNLRKFVTKNIVSNLFKIKK